MNRVRFLRRGNESCAATRTTALKGLSNYTRKSYQGKRMRKKHKYKVKTDQQHRPRLNVWRYWTWKGKGDWVSDINQPTIDIRENKHHGPRHETEYGNFYSSQVMEMKKMRERKVGSQKSPLNWKREGRWRWVNERTAGTDISSSLWFGIFRGDRWWRRGGWVLGNKRTDTFLLSLSSREQS